MNERKAIGAVLIMSLLLAVGAWAAEPVNAHGAAAVLAELKAKDSAFDNAVLRYTWSEESRSEGFPYWKFPGMTPEKGKAGPYAVKSLVHAQLVVRGKDTTYEGQLDPNLKQGPESRGWSPVPFTKWGETGGVVRMISDSMTGSDHDRTLEIQDKGGPVGLLDEERMQIAFVHGFGFGSRIKTIESIVREGDRRIVQGTIQIWWEDISTFRLELGDDLLVRKAEIDCDVKGVRTRFEVTTEGSIEREGFRFARTGHFRRMSMTWKDPARTILVPRVTKEFSARFDDARFHLLDAEYDAMTRMEMTPGTEVRDHITNRRFHVEADGTVMDRGELFSKNR